MRLSACKRQGRGRARRRAVSALWYGTSSVNSETGVGAAGEREVAKAGVDSIGGCPGVDHCYDCGGSAGHCQAGRGEIDTLGGCMCDSCEGDLN